MAVCYLEVDDEITDAIGRLRAVKDDNAVLVVPPGSRIASSRINFKLLAREAAVRKLNLVAVSDEPQVRALAISAGLPAYDSLASAEQGLVNFREQDRRLAERLGESGDSVAGETRVLPAAARTPALTGTERLSSDTAVLPLEAGPGAERSTARTARQRGRRRGPPIAPLLVLVLVALLIGGTAYGAYLFLPTASITLRPLASEFRLPTFSVTADTNVAVVDATAGVIPAEQVSVPIHLDGDFSATGVQTRETRATGSVRFRSENTVDPVTIAAGTIVSTIDGIDFETLADAVVPRADFASSTPGTVDVDVRASRSGPRGNVDSGAVRVLSDALSAQLISVRNPQPISGGTRVDEASISQSDYDAALASLTSAVPAELAARLADSGSVPRGLVAFAATAAVGEIQPDQSAADLVDTLGATFSLAIDTNVVVVAVNEALLDEVAGARVSAQLDAGQTVVGGNVVASHDPGSVVGSSVVFEVSASALAYAEPDPQELISAVRGKSIAEARDALAAYGSAEISVWPDFVDRIPDQAARISLTIVPPVAT